MRMAKLKKQTNKYKCMEFSHIAGDSVTLETVDIFLES